MYSKEKCEQKSYGRKHFSGNTAQVHGPCSRVTHGRSATLPVYHPCWTPVLDASIIPASTATLITGTIGTNSKYNLMVVNVYFAYALIQLQRFV